jgi:hypothetical protein
MHAGAFEMGARGIGEQQLHRMHFGDRTHRARDDAIRLGFRVGHLERLDELIAEGAAAGLGTQPREHPLHGVREQVDHARERADFVAAVGFAAIVHVARGQGLRHVAHGTDRRADGMRDDPERERGDERRRDAARDHPPRDGGRAAGFVEHARFRALQDAAHSQHRLGHCRLETGAPRFEIRERPGAAARARALLQQ